MRKLRNDELDRLTIENYKSVAKMPLIVILDNVRSLNNIGSIFRSSDAFLVEKILLCGITAQPPHKDIHKTALGATDSVSWEYFPSTLEGVTRVKQDGYTIYAVEQTEGSIRLENFQLPESQKTAVIFGNEVRGVQQEIVDASDGCIEIEQYGTKHSLNISVCAGIVIWEIHKKMNKKKGNT